MNKAKEKAIEFFKDKLRSKIDLTWTFVEDINSKALDIAIVEANKETVEKVQQYNSKIAKQLMKNIGIVKFDGKELHLRIKNAVIYENEIFHLKRKISKVFEDIEDSDLFKEHISQTSWYRELKKEHLNTQDTEKLKEGENEESKDL